MPMVVARRRQRQNILSRVKEKAWHGWHGGGWPGGHAKVDGYGG